MAEYFDANRANWDDRAALHAARDGTGYDVSRYIADPTLISDVVRFDVPRLGPIRGLRVAHLQCHIGTDTLSLARLGAHVAGLDFSPAALEQGRQLVADAGVGDAGGDVTFVEANVYDALDVLPAASFDMVYTGIGALCWLPRIGDWACVVGALLRPGGSLFVRDAHPVLLAADMDATDIKDGILLRYPYFNQPEPVESNLEWSYVPTSRPLKAKKTFEWNHGIGEIVTALLDAGLQIELLQEHDTVSWDAFPGRMTDRGAGEMALTQQPSVAPLTFTIRARKPLAAS